MGFVKNLAVKATRKAIEKSPLIFATMAVGCAFATAYGFVKATLKSREALDERDDQLAELKIRFEEDPSIDEEAQKQMIKQVNLTCAKKIAPNYIIPFITLGVEVTSIVMCHKGHGKREALFAGLLNTVNDNAGRVIDKASEEVGKKKIQTVKDDAAIDKIKEVARSNPTIIETGHGSEIFIHEPTGQVFRCSTAWVERGINEVDNMLASGSDDFVEMDDLLEKWGGRPCGFGKLAGFPVERFTKFGGYNGMSLFDQTRIVSWDNPDTGEVWKIIKHPYEIYADGNHVSVPAY